MNEEMTFRMPKKLVSVTFFQYSYFVVLFGFIFSSLSLEFGFNIYLLFIPLVGGLSTIYYILLIPYKIKLSKETIIFKSVLKSTAYPISDIIKIKSSIGYIKFKFAKKKSILIHHGFTNFYLLMYHLKEKNPEIDNYGC